MPKPAIHWIPLGRRDPLFALSESDDPEVTAFDLMIEDAMRRGDRQALARLLADTEEMLASFEVER